MHRWSSACIEGKPAGMWGSLVLLTLFQILTGLQLIIAQGDKATTTIPLTFFVFTVIAGRIHRHAPVPRHRL